MADDTPWYVRKPYIHFDLPLSRQAAKEYVSHPQNIVTHPFYPLLSYTLSSPRIIKGPRSSGRPFVKSPKERPIAYPAHRDGYIYSYYKSILNGFYEEWLEANSLSAAVTAFRPKGENNVTLAKKAFDFIKANPGCQIVVTDVESFFNNLDHKILKQVWARFLCKERLPDHHYAVFKSITRYSVVLKHKAYNQFRIRISGKLKRGAQPLRICTPQQFREKLVKKGLVKFGEGVLKGKGIPQGTSLSPLLSNMYLAPFDLALDKRARSLGGNYWRYCDDILMVIPAGDVSEIKREIDEELGKLRLSRNHDKTDTWDGHDALFNRPLQYLGFLFDGSQIRVRSSSIHRYHRKVKKALRAAEARRGLEGRGKGQKAPLRKQALFNMYSDMPIRGKKAKERSKIRKHNRNFLDYMKKAAARVESEIIPRQQHNLVKRLRAKLREHTP